MINSQRPDKFSLGSLFNKLKDGNFVIPDFQRDFEWDPWDVTELMKSVFLDYYVGTLLLWKAKKEDFQSLSCEPIYGHKLDSKTPIHIVLDGQQRLTAIYYACFAPQIRFPDRKSRCFFYVNIDLFMREEYDNAFGYDWDSQHIEKLLASSDEQYQKNIFPLSMLGKDTFALVTWLNGYSAFWGAKKAAFLLEGKQSDADQAQRYFSHAQKFTEHIQLLLGDYHISYIELDEGLGIEKVCDIFTQINSRGVKLDIFDLMNAMLVPKELQLKLMWRNVEDRLSFANTNKMNIYVLQVMSIFLQNYCSSKYLYFLIPGSQKPIRNPDGSSSQTVLIKDKVDFETNWSAAVSAIEDALRILRSPHDYGAISPAFIPYPTIIPVFSALRREAQLLTNKGFSNANRKVRKWYWASIFTNAYSSAAESTSAKDYREVKAWMEDDKDEPTAIGKFKESIKHLDLRTESRKGSAIYNAIFNLLIINGAKDWSSLDTPSYDALDDHHIVPVSWGNKQKQAGLVEDAHIHSILNRSPLSESTNRYIISDRLPKDYFPEMFKQHGEAAVRNNLAAHFISSQAVDILLRPNFGPADYREFLAARQVTIIQALQDLLIHERIDIDPTLRDLDIDIEKVELSVRKLIVEILGEDPQKIPQHIREKAEERIQNELKKDASKNPEDYKTTGSYLEFFDMSEYMNTISNKVLWPDFQNKLGNKDIFLQRFSKLAEVRNMIRHSRSVDVVAKKEGEASVMWFIQLLGA